MKYERSICNIHRWDTCNKGIYMSEKNMNCKSKTVINNAIHMYYIAFYE